ncbi:MAG: DUF2793 domain-containing protein [Exiguobacterium profundum]|nr:MAG: DUF2793 domain-containing protein [Exiguobacterium profundum]
MTHNEAIDRLDGLVQLVVQGFAVNDPPEFPEEGRSGRSGPRLRGCGSARGQAGAAAQQRLGFHGAGRRLDRLGRCRGACPRVPGVFVDLLPTNPALMQNLSGVGVNTSADAVNRLAVSAPATLFSHEGQGHQLKVNKAVADTASLLFQSGWSGRAEMGLAGSDSFAVKVSGDGTSFVTALEVTSGRVQMPVGLALGAVTGDPVAPQEGWLWLNQTAGQVRVRRSGASVAVGAVSVPFLVPPSGEHVLTTMGSGTTTGTTAGAAGRMDLFPFSPRLDMTIDQMVVNVTTAVASALGKLVVYLSDANGRPDARLLETGDMDFGTTGLKSVAVSAMLWGGATYWLGLRHSSTATVSAWQSAATPDINGGAPVTTARKILRRTLSYGTAAPSSWGYLGSEISASFAPAIWLRMA